MPVYHPPSQRPDGNRIVEGRGTFPRVQHYILETGGLPLWLDSVVRNVRLSLRYVREDEATIYRFDFDLTSPDVMPRSMRDDQLLPDVFAGALALLMPPTADHLAMFADIAPDTRAIAYGEGAALYISRNGELMLRGDGESVSRFEVNAMLDSIPVVNAIGQIAIYVTPTERYAHNVLGNAIEAAALLVLSPVEGRLVETTRIVLPDDEVFEGVSPLWADVDGDGTDDLVTTVSNVRDGARLVVYRADGTLLAESPAIGQRFRWRHQLAFGPFGPNGESEMVEVQTPHLGGIVQFWQYDPQQAQLVLSARMQGYTSHLIGSANLDQVVAGDFNGDGTPEVVLMTQRRDALVGLQRSAEGIREVWRFLLDAPPASNFAAIPLPDGSLGLAIALGNNQLQLWLPDR